MHKRLFALLCFILAVCVIPVSSAESEDLPFEILEPVVVQDYGFEKSLMSFAKERIGSIGKKARAGGEHPIGLLFGMIYRTADWRKRPIFKVEHPKLVELYGGEKYISADTYMDGANRRKMIALLRPTESSKPDPSIEAAINRLDQRVRALLDVKNQLAIIPQKEGDWRSPNSVQRDSLTTGSTARAIMDDYTELANAYAHRDAKAFAAAAHDLVAANRKAAEESGVNLTRLRVDLINTQIRPFHWSARLYLLATLLYVCYFVSTNRRWATAGLIVMVLGLVAHCTGLTLRAILVGRAPMSNMFESLVFAVGGMVAIAAVLDRVYKNALIGLAGALLGFIFIVIAIKMPIDDSRINPLMPALQSSWLTYHVTTVMLSYSAFALSFFVSVIYLLKLAFGGDETRVGVFRTMPDLERLDFYNYRIIAVGFPLLTIGIFTGAVWAATAWGRPWAFDPKETWSAITWLIYGVYLHTRFLKGWKGTRSAILGIVGFAAVLFTYLGVNYILSGLHSYV